MRDSRGRTNELKGANKCARRAHCGECDVYIGAWCQEHRRRQLFRGARVAGRCSPRATFYARKCCWPKQESRVACALHDFAGAPTSWFCKANKREQQRRRRRRLMNARPGESPLGGGRTDDDEEADRQRNIHYFPDRTSPARGQNNDPLSIHWPPQPSPRCCY